MSLDWNESKLVGNSAENIVEYLINSMPDWKCCKFGVENHIIEIRNMMRGVLNPLTRKVKRMPDFIAFNERTKKSHFIEVKYSSNKNKVARGYLFKQMEEYAKYWEGTKLVIVRVFSPHLVWIDLDKLEDSMREIVPIRGQPKISWNFGNLEQDIKTLFPDLKDDDIKLATSRIVPKTNEISS